MKLIIKILTIFIFLCAVITAYPQSIIDTLFIENEKKYNVQEYLYLLSEHNDSSTFEFVKEINEKQYIPFSDYIPHLKRNTSYWLKLKVRNQLDIDRVFYLEAGITQEIDFYDIDENGQYVKKQYGYSIPDGQKEYSDAVAEVVGFTLRPYEQKTLYFRVKSELNLKPSPLFRLHEQIDFKNYLSVMNILQGFFHGMLWMMIIYMLFMYMNIRDRAYLYYIFYSAAVSISVIILMGYPRHYLFPDTRFHVLTSELILQIGSVFYMLLFRKVLHIKQLSKIWRRFYFISISLSIIGIILSAILIKTNFYAFNLTSQIFIFFELQFYLVTIIGLYRYRNSETQYYFIGNICVTAGALTITVGLLFLHEPFLKFFPHFQLGITLELLFFAIGLSKRYQMIEKQKRAAQEQYIKELQENEALQKQINEDLEEIVAERTRQITLSKQEIERQKSDLIIKHMLLEDSNKQLTDNLEYAGFIQNALLDDFNKCLAENCIDGCLFYRPHSYVSGDFYMFFNISESKFLVVLADCTGHGVPGAILTMIAQDFITDIVRRKQIHEPAQILTNLEERVKTRLLRNNSNKSLNEGLDAAIVLVDKEKMRMKFAGAKIPIIIFSNGNINRIRGGMFGIGGKFFCNNCEKEFVQHEISFSKNDSFYLSSDGYTDQLNGMMKKYKSGRYISLIEQISLLSGQEQKQKFIEDHEKWKGIQDQTDDILVLGIKL